MINYIKAELYRNFNRTYLWGYTALMSVFALAMNILMKIFSSANSGYGLYAMFAIITNVLIVPIFLIVPILDMSIAEEQKNQTMKNTLAFGLSRDKFVLSKFIVSIILSLIFGVIMLGVFYGSGAILFGLGAGSSAMISDALIKLLISLPLWIGAISIGIFLSLAISNNTAFTFVYTGIFLVVSLIIKILYKFVSNDFINVYNILISTQLKSFAGKLTSHGITLAVVSGIIYTLVFMILSLIYFNRKEIK